MDTKQRPPLRIGLLIGVLLTLPLMALLFLADQALGLPFFPFDLFDFASRLLPGAVLTFGIDAMVDLIIALNLGEVSAAAKTAEQLMGLGAFLLLGAIAIALFYALLNRRGFAAGDAKPGIVFGLGAGAVMLLVSSQVNLTATAHIAAQIVWALAVFAVWALAANGAYNVWANGGGVTVIEEQTTVAGITAAKVDLGGAVIKTDPETGEKGVYFLNRRKFLVRVGGMSAALTVAGAGLGALFRPQPTEGAVVAGLPAGDASVDGLPNAGDPMQPAPGTRPEYTPLDEHYRIDISSRPPVIDSNEWRLEVSGLVDNPVSLSLRDLYDKFERVERYITLSCISNRIGGSLISTTKWSGFPARALLDLVQPQESAVALKITGADNFDEYVMLDLLRADDRIMFAYEWDDKPLKQKHGFPLRIYIPDRYGMKQPKWIKRIEFVDAWAEGYWVRRSWSREAMVNTTSVVDAVAVDSILKDAQGYVVPIGGIAYAGAKRISKVEVSVNSGEWQEARLRQPLSELTWALWRYDWRFQEGEFKFEVRAYDGDGVLQSLEPRGTRPDGATGVHARKATMPSRADLENPPEAESE